MSSALLHWPSADNSEAETVGKRGPGMGLDSPALKVEPNALYLNVLPLHVDGESCTHVCIQHRETENPESHVHDTAYAEGFGKRTL